jgi:hypothetical protein
MSFLPSKPLQALEHPSFKKMIGIAARASKGMTIPNRKATRDVTINMFETQMTHLKNRFKVRSAFSVAQPVLFQSTRIDY